MHEGRLPVEGRHQRGHPGWRCVCVEWVLHTTQGVYGFPTNGHTWGITKLDIVLEIYSHLHTLNLNIIELLALQGDWDKNMWGV